MGPYHEIDFLAEPGSIVNKLGKYFSVMVIKEAVGINPIWLSDYAGKNAIDFDGTTIYIYRMTYEEACRVLRKVFTEYDLWKEATRAPFPGDKPGSTDGTKKAR